MHVSRGASTDNARREAGSRPEDTAAGGGGRGAEHRHCRPARRPRHRFPMTHRTGVVVALLCATLFPLASKSTLAQPYIYVANTGEDTVSKIDVTTNTVVATYRTWFGPTGPNVFAPRTTNSSAPGPAPSRIVVDSSGNVFVLDRFFGPSNTSFSPCPLDLPLKRCHLPVLLKILPSGGTPSSNTSAGYQQLPILDGNNDNHLDEIGRASCRERV